MANRDLDAAWSYHNSTKHSYDSIHTDAHYLDWENQPLPFKIYQTLDPMALPQDLLSSGVPALTAVSAFNPPVEVSSIPPLSMPLLASLLYFSAGITKRKQYPGGEILFRAAACTGALYHIELYLVCADLPELQAGVYHFGPGDFALRCLRQGEYRQLVVQATGGEPAVAAAPLTVICTGTLWRNAWKYRARTYRHCFWDTGTMLANLLAVSAAHTVPAKVVMGFVDDTINRLLGLDTEREVALALVTLGHAAQAQPGPLPALEPLQLDTVPLSNKEVDYPAIREMHVASTLRQEAETWHGRTPPHDWPAPTGELFPLRPLSAEEVPPDTIEQVILRRGSSRRFARAPMSFAQLSTLLLRATGGIPADFLESPGAMLNDLYLIVNAVDDLPSGTYIVRRDHQALELLRRGDFRRDAGYLGLMQEIPADASVNVFFLTDLHAVLGRFGNRGYRAAQLEAGLIGGKLYLAAYAQRLGASGLTFFDDDVTRFFAPHAADKSVMFLVALGKAGRLASRSG